MESVEYRPQARRHPHRLASGRHQAPSRRRGLQPPAATSRKAVHREREMASSRQRVEFDWRVLGARRPCRFSG